MTRSGLKLHQTRTPKKLAKPKGKPKGRTLREIQGGKK